MPIIYPLPTDMLRCLQVAHFPETRAKARDYVRLKARTTREVKVLSKHTLSGL